MNMSLKVCTRMSTSHCSGLAVAIGLSPEYQSVDESQESDIQSDPRDIDFNDTLEDRQRRWKAQRPWKSQPLLYRHKNVGRYRKVIDRALRIQRAHDTARVPLETPRANIGGSPVDLDLPTTVSGFHVIRTEMVDPAGLSVIGLAGTSPACNQGRWHRSWPNPLALVDPFTVTHILLG
ncbi:hypothetical protein K439DRAFT_665981 [Ramaria rubella]|nr:hypothetical protein K439DRAFT_665981 [Ramaria rubella]